MQYKAIFFDRDNTLTYGNPEKKKWRNEKIESWSGKEFEFDYDKMMKLFDKAKYPENGLKTIEAEIEFEKRYYYQMLLNEGIYEELEERADMLFKGLWCNNDRLLFDEVIEVLEYFKNKGYKIGVISDTSPSLQLTIEQLGLQKYFDSYTCSDIVGVMKPDPAIYNTALHSLEVKAEESIYVDDYDVEADGARELGFTAFHIDRKSESKVNWTICSLKEIIEFVENERGRE
jgi:putative hydrolase of the HAD superfamily